VPGYEAFSRIVATPGTRSRAFRRLRSEALRIIGRQATTVAQSRGLICGLKPVEVGGRIFPVCDTCHLQRLRNLWET
jgi:hypothetical protein